MSPTGLGVRAVLQAGGKGSRLFPATQDMPKPLIKVAGVPMIERLLRQLIGCGLRQVTIITGWMGEHLEEYVQGLADLPEDLQIDFIRESRPLGNVGGLGHLQSVSEPVLFLFADLVTNLDFAQLVAIHRQKNTHITLASHYETHQLQLGEILVHDDQVTGYQEKPFKEFLICSGIAVFDPPVLKLLDGVHPSGISDLINATIARGMTVSHWTHGAVWVDVNTPEALEKAESELKGN